MRQIDVNPVRHLLQLLLGLIPKERGITIENSDSVNLSATLQAQPHDHPYREPFLYIKQRFLFGREQLGR